MRETKLSVVVTTAFKRDYKLAMKRGLKINLLEDVIAALAMGKPLPEKNKDHALTGNWVGHIAIYLENKRHKPNRRMEEILSGLFLLPAYLVSPDCF